jgi:hypothetical protein
MPADRTPVIPPDLVDTWDELLTAAERRESAEESLAQESARCRELVVKLLRGGVARADLVDRPFSSAMLTKIQQAEGLTKKDREQPDS